MDFFSTSKLAIGLEENPQIELMLSQLEQEVEDFYSTFSDDPSKPSAWGHHYFCKEDGSVLTYNPENENEHQCPLCGEVYSSPLLTRVWRTIYRNEAALAILKAAVLYKAKKEQKYMNTLISIASLYFDSYEQFQLHNKEDEFYDDLSDFAWGCGRIMPQCLHASIFFIRIFTGLELVKDELPEAFLKTIEEGFSEEFFALASPQVDKVHNISCWLNSAIGVIGLFSGNEKMIKFAFDGTFNINRQLREGVTEDGFWYEGSIHYNFFTLEGVSYLALFAQRYEHSFEEITIIKKMLVAAYNYAFSNQELPNPNDGWPKLNLKTYSYIYAIGTKLFGATSEVGELFVKIISAPYTRGEIPLSKPCYFNNDLSLEQLLFVPEIHKIATVEPNRKSMDMEKSNYALLKNESVDVFYKYGHNGPSHAHPDKMTIEVMLNDLTLTRDLSNSGYGSVVCNEWHRRSSSHNTVVVDGQDHTSSLPGKKLSFSETASRAMAEDVYAGVDFEREIILNSHGFDDLFIVSSNEEHVYDNFFHVEATLLTDLNDIFTIVEGADLGYQENGYSYFKNIRELVPNQADEWVTLTWLLGTQHVVSKINIKESQLFIADSPSNPISEWRTSIILRQKGQNARFEMSWIMQD